MMNVEQPFPIGGVDYPSKESCGKQPKTSTMILQTFNILADLNYLTTP
jgi:hypothetical protein